MIKTMIKGAAILAVLASALPQSASAFVGKRGTRIAPVSSAVFEVVVSNTGGVHNYWCGASSYARRVLKVDGTTKIYIARGPGPSLTSSRKSAVHFTIDPAAAGIEPIEPQISLALLTVGDNMSAQQAEVYCHVPSIVF